MKLHSKKLISLILAVVLVLGIFPMAGFAVEGEEPVLAQELATPGDLTTDNPSSPSTLPPETPSTLPEGTATPTPTPEITPTSEEQTPMPSVTPSSLDVSELLGEELFNYLNAIEDNAAFTVAYNSLSRDQQMSLVPFINNEIALAWYERTIAITEEEIVDYTEIPFKGVGPLLHTSSAKPSMRLFAISPEEPFVTPNSGLILAKTASTADGFTAADPMYRLNLSAQAQSSIVITKQPCDIVLVLDVSGSMEGTKLQDMKVAANAFVTNVHSNAPASRIALVPFSSDIFTTGDNQWRGLTPVANSDGTKNGNLETWINALDANGSTYSDAGLKKAQEILSSVPTTDAKYSNARVVIMLTDGIPGDGSWDDWFSPAQNTAQDAIHWATILKASKGTPKTVDINQTFRDTRGNDFAEWDWDDWEWRIKSGMSNKVGCGATVYTIGFSLLGSDITNEYMFRVSSHRSDGTRVPSWNNANYTNGATRNLTNGYYLTAENRDRLNNIFQDISKQMGTPIENVTIRDYIDTHFQLVNASGTALAVGATVVAGSYSGIVKSDAKGVYVEWTGVTLTPPSADGQTPAQTFAVTLYVKPKAGFAGGNEVPTNISGISAVYNGTTNIGSFPKAKVNVPIVFPITPHSRSIYLGNQVAVNSLYDTPDLTGWQYDYLDSAVYSVKQGTAPITGNISPITDTVYNITALVKPALDGLNDTNNEPLPGVLNSMAGVTLPAGGANATVYVFKPQFTATNVGICLTNTTDLNPRVALSPTWVRVGSLAGTPPTPIMGTAPTIAADGLTFQEAGTLVPIAAPGAYKPADSKDSQGIKVASVTLSNGKAITTSLPSFTVYVAKPTVACKDGEMFLGETLTWGAYLSTFNPPAWAFASSVPSDVTLPATKPSLSYQIVANPVPSAFTPTAGGRVNFTIKSWVGTTEITNYTTFVNPNLNDPNDPPGDHHFTIQVKTGTLTIKKSIPNNADAPNPDESFLFTITGPAGTTLRAVIKGTGTTTITGLPKGTYTVTEDTNWSWRYNTTTPAAGYTKEIDSQNPTASCEFVNSSRTPFWLSGESSVANKFKPYNPGA